MNRRHGFFALMLFLSSALFAQATRVELFGVIKDSAGLPVPGAMVEIRNPATQTSTAVVSGPDGVYRFVALNPGIYELTIRKEGFALLRRSGLALRVGD